MNHFNLIITTVPQLWFLNVQNSFFSGGVPEKADYAYVTIEVSDRSDNAPVFVTSQYDVRVFDTSAVGSVVTHVTAIDRDRGYSGVVTYTCDKCESSMPPSL